MSIILILTIVNLSNYQIPIFIMVVNNMLVGVRAAMRFSILNTPTHYTDLIRSNDRRIEIL